MTDTSESLNAMTVRTLTYIVGHDAGGRGGRMSTDAFATAEQGLMAASSLQPEDVGVTVASATQGEKADSALQPTAQTFTAPQRSQIQENLGIDHNLIGQLFAAWIASLPTSGDGLSVGQYYNNNGTPLPVLP